MVPFRHVVYQSLGLDVEDRVEGAALESMHRAALFGFRVDKVENGAVLGRRKLGSVLHPTERQNPEMGDG